jgi:hypothetical protein
MSTNRDPNRDEHAADSKAGKGSRVDEPETTANQERGERIDTGKTIARGGKEKGHVPGADESK